jgi:hypothetical protein
MMLKGSRGSLGMSHDLSILITFYLKGSWGSLKVADTGWYPSLVQLSHDIEKGGSEQTA